MSARYIYYAGKEWKSFDFKKGFEYLVNSGDPEFLFYAGAHWKHFDYIRGMEELLKTGSCEYIYKAGTLWKKFDYRRGWDLLERNVSSGGKWRALAFQNGKWKPELRTIWAPLWEK